MAHYPFQYQLAEWRHSPCLMQPVSLVMLVLMLTFWLVTALLTLPTMLLGLLMAPLLARGSWLIEFLYPWPIARWGHLLILKWSQPRVPLEDKAARYHSRTLEQRVEVVEGRVFIHPIPQLLDNLGYLVVCLPPPLTEPPTVTVAEDTFQSRLSIQTQTEPDARTLPKPPIVAFLVDCGDADAVQEQITLIRKTHYPQHPHIRLQMVLSTHKHHDHTAGNEALLKHEMFGKYLTHIVGGAVEKVPGCNMPVSDGDRINLPKAGRNDMNDLVHVEVVAVPAHTRGSVVYLLRPNKAPVQDGNGYTPGSSNCSTSSINDPLPCFVFTGDTIFSGGGGVPFEAGTDNEIDSGSYRDNAHGAIRAGVGTHAVERCFAEVLFRGFPNVVNYLDPERIQQQYLIFAGHEYTTELLARQLRSPAAGLTDATKWKNFPPHMFFETVSELYVALHRRSLPQATGKTLAAAPTNFRKELSINPHLRSLARRAELVVHAIRVWDAYFFTPKGPSDEEAAMTRITEGSTSPKTKITMTQTIPTSSKTKATEGSWNVDHHDVASTVFTTLYTSDLDDMIQALASGKLAPDDAATELENMKQRLKEPVIRRRPIPGTLPSERVVFKGLIGFALLGSRPSAMSLSDSKTMKIPAPIIRDMSCILVSKKRLIAILGHLGYLSDSDGPYLLAMIHNLWQEASDYANNNLSNAAMAKDGNETSSSQNDAGDDDTDESQDLIKLGTLKWILYGFPATQPDWWSKFCMPCGITAADKALQKRQDGQAQQEHPVQTSLMKRRHGELVRHDVITCMLCKDATGCPQVDAGEHGTRFAAAASSDAPSDEEGDVQVLKSAEHHINSPTNSDGVELKMDDDGSCVYTTDDDSAVEVAALPKLLGGGDSFEERVRL